MSIYKTLYYMCVKIILIGQLYIKYRATMIAMGQNIKYIQKRTTKIRQHGFTASYWTRGSVFLFQEVFYYCLPELKGCILGEGQLCTFPRLMFLSEIFYWLLLETGYWSRQPVVWPSGLLEALSLYLEECYCKCLQPFLWFHLSSICFNAVFIKCLILPQPQEAKISFNAITI